jgi:hypothetical protein
MGQASSTQGQKELNGEDLLFHVLDNEAVVTHLISNGTYRHFNSDVSKLREGTAPKGSVADAHDYFHDLPDADQVTFCTPPPHQTQPTRYLLSSTTAAAGLHGDRRQNYEVGTKKWWRSYAAAKLSGSSAPERYGPRCPPSCE